MEISNLIATVFLLDQKSATISVANLKAKFILLADIVKKFTKQETMLFNNWVRRILIKRVPVEDRRNIEKILDEAKPWEVEKMVSNFALALDEICEQAKEEGVEKGIEKGILLTAKAALQNGASIDFVAKITGLDLEKVKGLKGEAGNKI